MLLGRRPMEATAKREAELHVSELTLQTAAALADASQLPGKHDATPGSNLQALSGPDLREG